jgi:hypothetical protein
MYVLFILSDFVFLQVTIQLQSWGKNYAKCERDVLVSVPLVLKVKVKVKLKVMVKLKMHLCSNTTL